MLDCRLPSALVFMKLSSLVNDCRHIVRTAQYYKVSTAVTSQMARWLVFISLVLSNDVETNPGPLKSPEKRKSKLKRNKSTVRDSGVSSASSVSPSLTEETRKVEEICPTPTPEPLNTPQIAKEGDDEKVKILQSEISQLQVCGVCQMTVMF